jgi:prolipoprotein diacylglyceryltransferase
MGMTGFNLFGFAMGMIMTGFGIGGLFGHYFGWRGGIRFTVDKIRTRDPEYFDRAEGMTQAALNTTKLSEW